MFDWICLALSLPTECPASAMRMFYGSYSGFCIHLVPRVTWLMIMRSSGCHFEIVGSQNPWWKDRLLQQVKEWPLLASKSCHIAPSCTDSCGWSWTSEIEHGFYVEIFGHRVTCVIHYFEKLFPLLKISPSFVGERTNSGQTWFKSWNENFKGSKFSRQPW